LIIVQIGVTTEAASNNLIYLFGINKTVAHETVLCAWTVQMLVCLRLLLAAVVAKVILISLFWAFIVLI